MPLRYRVVPSLCVIGALGLCFTAAAQPGSGPAHREERREVHDAAKAARQERKDAAADAREERKKAAEDAREDRKEAAEEAREEKKGLRERAEDAQERAGRRGPRARPNKYPAVPQDQVAKRTAKRDARLAELKKDRADRRQANEEELKKKWGELTEQPAARAELRHHAWRIARLEAIRRIAQDEGKSDVVARADKLIEKENARHARAMENLKRAQPAGSASAAASGTAPGKGPGGGPPPARNPAAARPEAPKGM